MASHEVRRAQIRVVLGYAAVFAGCTLLNALFWLSRDFASGWDPLDLLELICVGELGPFSMLIWQVFGLVTPLVLLLICLGGVTTGFLFPRNPAAIIFGGIAVILWILSGWVVAAFLLY